MGYSTMLPDGGDYGVLRPRDPPIHFPAKHNICEQEIDFVLRLYKAQCCTSINGKKSFVA